MAGIACASHQLEAGVGDERRPGVRYQCNALAGGEPGHQLRAGRRGVVLVVGGERRGDAVMVEQPSCDAGVLAGDQIGRGQGLERPQRDVAQVADRGGDQMQASSEPRGLDRLAGQKVGLTRSLARSLAWFTRIWRPF